MAAAGPDAPPAETATCRTSRSSPPPSGWSWRRRLRASISAATPWPTYRALARRAGAVPIHAILADFRRGGRARPVRRRSEHHRCGRRHRQPHPHHPQQRPHGLCRRWRTRRRPSSCCASAAPSSSCGSYMQVNTPGAGAGEALRPGREAAADHVRQRLSPEGGACRPGGRTAVRHRRTPPFICGSPAWTARRSSISSW